MRALMRGQPVDRLAVELHAAGFVLQGAADAIDQRALARAVRADQPEPLARLHLEVDAVESDEPVEALADIVDVQQRAHGCLRARRRSCTSPIRPLGAMMTKADQHQADDQQVDRRGDGDGGDLLQRAEQNGADQRADPAGGAADHRHGDRVDRVFKAEGRRRLQIADVVGERRAGHAHEGARQRGGDQLQAQRRHAGGFRRQFVVADGGEAEAELRALDRARGHQRDHRQRQHQHEQIFDVVDRDAGEFDALRADDIGAARAADIVPVDHQRLQHHRERERGDGEERAAQPQRQIAHAEADDAGHDARRSRSAAGSAADRSLCMNTESRRPSRRRRPSRNSHSRNSRRGCSRRSPAR